MTPYKTDKHGRPQQRFGFSLLEVLCVLAILSFLSALLFPVFLTVRGKARQVVCASHLKQIGLGVSMYAQDYDGLYPYAVDPVDRAAPSLFEEFPDFEADIPRIGLMHEVLQPYIHSPAIFSCPADIGLAYSDFEGILMDAFPSSYGAYGTSYHYRSEIAARHAGEMTFSLPAQVNVIFDGAGSWHGTLVPLTQRYNTLFADGHVKNISRDQMAELWLLPLTQTEDEEEEGEEGQDQ